MADDADLSDARIEAAITAGVEAARLKVKPPRHYIECNWCGDPTEDGARYCCKDCATDHMRYNSARKRNGIETED